MVSRRAALTLLVLFLASSAGGQRNPEEESRYNSALARISAEAAREFERATQAMDAGDSEAAERGYRKVLALVPDSPAAFRRLSFVVRDRSESLRLARRASSLEDHGYNTTAVVRALLQFEDARSRQEAHRLAEKLLKQLPDEPIALGTVSMAAVVNEDRRLLAAAVDRLRKVEPDGVNTHTFSALEAAFAGKWEEAERDVRRAQELGLPAEQAQALLAQTGISRHARTWRYARYAGYGALVWLFGLALLFGVGILLSKVTLRAVETAPPEATGAPPTAMSWMRRIYAAVLGVTSFYYYLSIPVVLLIVLAAGGGALYALWSLGRVPVKLVLIVVIVVVVTVFGILKSLFLRVREEDPGHRLEDAQAPVLFAALREVASKVGTPPVDTVFVVPDATIAVFERGSPFQGLGRRTERCLVLGLGALEGMSELQLKAILGHEYGHLSNRDTAGGRVALHVRRSILASAQSLAAGGAGRWYNPAWLFLIAFHRLYLQVSQGASRLQEVLADRWAALAYGARAFAQGLRHVVRRAIEFDQITNREIQLALKQSRSLSNLYTLAVSPDFLPGEDHPEGARSPLEAIEKAFEKAMSDPGSPFDSHPPPAQRMAWVERLQGAPVLEDPGREAWALVPGRERLQEMMTRRVGDQVKAFLALQEALAQQAAQP